MDLAEEFALWKDASDKDWLKIEKLLKEPDMANLFRAYD
jgi:hypothetical protein